MTLPNFARSLLDEAGIGPRTTFDYAVLVRLLRVIEAHLRPLEAAQSDLEEATEALRRVGLARINEVLTPAIESILRVQERGFLIARSASVVTLDQGNIVTLAISDVDEATLFTPSPFTIIASNTTPDDFAVARTIAYDREVGSYQCEVISQAGNPGPHGDWTIAALAGATLAQIHLAAQVEDIADQVIPAVATAIAARDEAVPAAAQAVLARNKAAAWADEDEDVEVEPGRFSAKHHAMRAEAAASTVDLSGFQRIEDAVQPSDLGTAAAKDASEFATAAQGALAETAAQIYTGSNANETDYPLGTIVLVSRNAADSEPAINASRIVCFGGGGRFIFFYNNSPPIEQKLSGLWRSRGSMSSNTTLMQRVS